MKADALLTEVSSAKATKAGGEMDMSVNYKWLYVGCGVIMLLAIAIIGFKFLVEDKSSWQQFVTFYDNHQMTFWMEVVALEFFGLSWLVKGRNTVTNATYSAFKSSRAAH